jgi:hypothetical protein
MQGPTCVCWANLTPLSLQFADVGAKVDSPEHAGYFLPFRSGATSPAECWCASVQANVLVCANETASDVHVPMCDGADR